MSHGLAVILTRTQANPENGETEFRLHQFASCESWHVTLEEMADMCDPHDFIDLCRLRIGQAKDVTLRLSPHSTGGTA